MDAILDGLHNHSRNPKDWAVGANIAAGMEEVFLSLPFEPGLSRGLGRLAAILTRLPEERVRRARQAGREMAKRDPDAVREYLFGG